MLLVYPWSFGSACDREMRQVHFVDLIFNTESGYELSLYLCILHTSFLFCLWIRLPCIRIHLAQISCLIVVPCFSSCPLYWILDPSFDNNVLAFLNSLSARNLWREKKFMERNFTSWCFRSQKWWKFLPFENFPLYGINKLQGLNYYYRQAFLLSHYAVLWVFFLGGK